MFRLLPALVVGVFGLHAVLAAVPWSPPAAPGPATTETIQRGRPVPALAAGKLLIAARSLSDSNFFETVVLLIEVDKAGAVGLVLNRRSDITLDRVLPDLPASQNPSFVAFIAGPVSTSVVHVLSSTPLSDGLRLVDGVYLATSRKGLDTVLSTGAGPDDLRVYLGYAGWGEGQLEREIAVGAWHVLDADRGVVFDRNPTTLWRRQIARTEVLIVRNLPTVQVPGFWGSEVRGAN